MKLFYILAILLCIATNGLAQTPWKLPFPIDTATRKISYQAVVPVSHLPAHLLYERAKAWHAKVQEPATRIPLLEDKAAGLFIAKRVAMIHDHRFSYTVAIECHDGQYEYLFTDFYFLYPRTETPVSGGRVFVAFPKEIPLLDITQQPASLTPKGEVRPNIRRLLAEAHEVFTALISDLQHNMAY
ncbi:DUF4468 domain-containing protein [Hymenobacter swuensis]|uniref:DUF4468 domain-containing protein n=1 Tax=Hymenobacter swuensis TaxID=1446467 RepID=UPI0009005637|nr:DUF4468 domain-containing protein [Hymenobacter swuensis]